MTLCIRSFQNHLKRSLVIIITTSSWIESSSDSKITDIYRKIRQDDVLCHRSKSTSHFMDWWHIFLVNDWNHQNKISHEPSIIRPLTYDLLIYPTFVIRFHHSSFWKYIFRHSFYFENKKWSALASSLVKYK